MAQYNNILDNQNYINKDFQSIYQELLETVRKLSNKWMIDGDSNESDPVILLIKELAAVGDKCNYNSDKNILENFPKTVQQEVDARELFENVYKMNWYNAASGKINIRYSAEDGGSVTIPPFTMFSNADNSIVFTTTNIFPRGPVNKKESCTLDALQGVVETYTLQGDPVITIDKLVNNKVYFDDYNVAQNGIFVFDKGYLSLEEDIANVSEYGQWKMVDNFYTEQEGTKCFEFNVDVQTGTPYIEFPDYVEELIGSGLIIKFIKTLGSEGNLGINQVNTFYKTTTDGSIDASKITVANTSIMSNGADPETIESGYKNYKKNINVCKTLVTLRDYINAIYLGKNEAGRNLVSNCIVSDRTTDIQDSYKIGSRSVVERVEKTDKMSCFDLKFYGLRPVSDTETFADYQETFKLIDDVNDYDNIPKDVFDYIENVKHIQHNFKTVKNMNKICLIKNYYNLHITLVYKYVLQQSQIEEVHNNVKQMCIDSFNAREMNFGDRLQYKEVIDKIVGSDNRILACTVSGLDDKDFETYAVFFTPREEIAGIMYSEPQFSQNIGDIVVRKVDGADLNEIDDIWTFDRDQYKNVGTITSDSDFSNLDTSYIRIKQDDDTPHWQAVKASWVTTGADPRPYSIVAPTDEWSKDASEVKAVNKVVATKFKVLATESIPTDPRDGYIYHTSNNKWYVRDVNGTATDVTSSVSSSKMRSALLKNPVDSILTNGDVFVTNRYYDVEAGSTYSGYKFLLEDNSDSFVKLSNYKFYNKSDKGSFQEIRIDLENIDNLDLSRDDLTTQFRKEIMAKSVLNGNLPLYTPVEKFATTIKDREGQTSIDSGYVSPNVNISLSTSNYYVLDKNEYVQIVQPGYQDIAEYSFYVWCGYYKGSPNGVNSNNDVLRVSANMNYQLKEDEYFFVYYRANDGDNYSYVRYSAGQYICPNYTLTVAASPSTDWQRQLIGNNIPAEGTTSDIITSKIAENTTLYNTKLTVIDGQNKVVIRKPLVTNLMEATEDHVIQYLLNRNEDGERILFDAITEAAPEDITEYYVLDADEAVYIDSAVVLESGTVFRRIVRKDNTADALTSGIKISAKSDKYGEISYFTSDITQIGEGCQIRLTSELSLAKDVVEPDDSIVKDRVEYAFNTQDTAEFINVDFEDSSSKEVLLRWFENKIIPVGYDLGWKYTAWLTDNQYVTKQFAVYCQTASGDKGFSLNNTFQNLKEHPNLNLYYTPSKGEAEVMLDLNGSEFIEARSVLAINISNENDQVITDHYPTAIQTVDVYDRNGYKIFTAVNDNHLLASRPISLFGGAWQNIQYVGEAVDIYLKNQEALTPPSSSDNVKYVSNGAEIVFNVPGGTFSPVYMNITLQPWADFYVLKVSTNKTNAVIKAYVGETSTEIEDIYGVKEFNNNKVHYLKLNTSEFGAGKIRFEATGSTSESPKVYIDNLLTPYNNTRSDAILKKIVEKIITLDPDSLFDPTSQIEASREINNPLLAASFFNKNHLYNKVLMCEMSKEPEIV